MFELFDTETEHVASIQWMTADEAELHNQDLRDAGEPYRWVPALEQID